MSSKHEQKPFMSKAPGVSKLRPNKRPRKQWQAHILPCRICYSGPVSSASHWNPKTHIDGTLTVHLRGRRLKGKMLRLPPGYRGLVGKCASNLVRDDSLKDEIIAAFATENSDSDLLTRRQDEEELQSALRRGEYSTQEVCPIDEAGSTNNLVVWGHDALPDGSTESYSKAMNEWIKMADAMHGQSVIAEAETSKV